MTRVTEQDLIRAIRDLAENDPTGLDFGYVQRVNASDDGWTFEKRAGLGGTLRIEHVSFSDDTLRRCYDAAMR